MDRQKEMNCIRELETILEQNVPRANFSLDGYKESAVCMSKTETGWEVYVAEKNEHFASKPFDNVLEAALNMIERLFVDGREFKNLLLDAILVKRTA